VTDAMPSVGSDINCFDLMGRRVTLTEGRLTTDEGTLAGAHLDMASAVRNAVTLAGVSLDDALQAASLTPARFLGIANERGILREGARADLVALTDKLEVLSTWIAGHDEELWLAR
jgi:N-acetylglucosamine-6-phosphate deacetylase